MGNLNLQNKLGSWFWFNVQLEFIGSEATTED